MPVYAWKGLNNAGKAVGGTKDADGPKNLRQNLRKEGIFVTEHKEVLGGAPGRPGGGVKVASGEKVPFFKREIDLGGLLESVRPQDVAVLTRQLATLLKAGIPLAEALAALGEQADNKKLAMVLVEVREKVTQGTALAETFAAYPKIFPDLYVNMVRSLTYPLLMMVLGTIVMGILMVVVVPKITSVFDDLDKSLPWNTELLIFVSGVVGTFWWLLIPAAIFGYLGVKRWGRRPAGRAFFDRLKLRIWLIGPLVRFIAVARFARTLATMLAAGVPVLNALEIVKKVLNNTVLEKVIEEARDAIREGESIAAPLKRSGQFPSMMVHMVAVGERSGQLEAMLENVAGAYERDVEGKVARLTTVLSPMIIVVMALAVVFIVFSVLQPILDMQNFVQ